MIIHVGKCPYSQTKFLSNHPLTTNRKTLAIRLNQLAAYDHVNCQNIHGDGEGVVVLPQDNFDSKLWKM